MTRIEISGFRKTLETRRTELGDGSRNRREALTIEASSDELDRTQDASERDYAMGTLERNSDRLREVQDALRRIDGGAFGICAGCEEEINPRRLAAVPWASFCVVCQEAEDRGQRTTIEGEFDTDLGLAA